MLKDTELKHLTSSKTIDPISGEIRVRYYWKRKPLPQVRLEGILAEQLAGYTLIEKDLKNVVGWMKHAESLVPAGHFKEELNYKRSENREVFDLIKGLFVASLVFYAKAFSPSEARRAQLSRNSLDSRFREQHDFYLQFRHSFAAHSGSEKVELARTYCLLFPNKHRTIEPMLAIARLQPDIALPKPNDIGLSELAVHAIEIANKKFDKLSDKIMKEHILLLDKEILYKSAKRGQKIVLR